MASWARWASWAAAATSPLTRAVAASWAAAAVSPAAMAATRDAGSYSHEFGRIQIRPSNLNSNLNFWKFTETT